MQIGASILAGIAASALFWLFSNFLITLPASYQIGGMIACFVVFGGAAYWLGTRTEQNRAAPTGTRVASGLKGRDIDVAVDGVRVTGASQTEVISDVIAKRDIKARAKNVKTDS